MKSILLAFTLVLTVGASLAEEAAFNGVKVADAKGKQADARLIFSDTDHDLIIKVADHDYAVIPYGQVDKYEYEYTKKHRITQGAIVMVASLGAGAVVMLTSSKSHWLYIDYHEQNVPKVVVLRMDKKEYEKIFAAIKTHTGMDVQFEGNAGKKHPHGGEVAAASPSGM
jgi:hypothetical protein